MMAERQQQHLEPEHPAILCFADYARDDRHGGAGGGIEQAVNLGLFVSAFATTEFQAVQFMPAFVLPQILLCGLFVPREAMPAVLEAISNVLPLSYAVDAMQELTGAADAAVIWRSVAVVAGFALAALALGAATLRRRTP